MSLKILKDLHWSEDSNGRVYTITYQIHNSDINDYKNKYPRNAGADAWTLGNGTYIADTNFGRKDQHWTIFLKAYSAGYESTGVGSITQNDSMPKALRSYDVESYILPYTYWGIRRATTADVTDQIIRIQAVSGDDTATICRAGDWIYGNVTATEKTGSGVFTRCPFNKGSALTDSDMPIASYLDKEIKTDVFIVEFFSRYDIDHFAKFAGVNGSFGTSKTRPTITTDKVWVAQKQILEEIIKDNKRYTKVTRRCLRAPEIDGTQMRWTTPSNEWDW